MPTVRQLARLFRSLAEGDLSPAKQIADEIIAAETKKGHHSAAQVLKSALHAKQIRYSRAVDAVAGTGSDSAFLELALSLRTAPTRFKDVMLRKETQNALEQIVLENQHAKTLLRKGIRRRAKLLFVGPPGCGKSITAQAIANELGLPLFVVRFDAVIGSFLGQTAVHLRELFQYATETPCVMLFDEIDALGKQRGNALDVGELDRIVIALMQELEFLETVGVVIATSNLPKNLDQALWRRFDLALEFPAPRQVELQKYANAISAKFGLSRSQKVRQLIASTKSFADAEKIIESEARRVALEEL
jgi:SpoVK/Ycf46/Vps4 family AAA+-type ATPase